LRRPPAPEACRQATIADPHLEIFEGRFAIPATVQGESVCLLLNTGSELSELTQSAVQRFVFATRELPKQAIVSNGKMPRFRHMCHTAKSALFRADESDLSAGLRSICFEVC
jgi:hypothetical protein